MNFPNVAVGHAIRALSLCAVICCIQVTAAHQSVGWTAPAPEAVLRLQQPYPLEATATSGLPVTFRVAGGPAVISGTTVTATNAGTVVLVAEQAGNAQFSPARASLVVNRSTLQLSDAAVWPAVKGGPALGVFVREHLAYVAQGDAGLAIYDVSNPANPMFVGNYPTVGHAKSVQVVGNLAYVGTGGLEIIDVSNPSAPAKLGGVFFGTAYSVRVVGNLAYVAANIAGVVAVDISDPSHPVVRGALPNSAGAYDVRVEGNRAFAATWLDGFRIYDISLPDKPVAVGVFPAACSHVAVNLGTAYLAVGGAGVLMLDVRNPAKPVELGRYPGPGDFMHVEVVDGLVYAGSLGNDGVHVVDVSQPAAPTRVGILPTFGGAHFQVMNGTAYVGGNDSGLQIIDCRQPAKPERLGAIDTVGLAQAVTVAGDLAFVAAGAGGLQVFDVSHASGAKRIGGIPLPGFSTAVSVSGNHAFVWCASRMQIVDVSDPAHPVWTAAVASSGGSAPIGSIDVADHHAYVVDYYGNLEIHDVTEPANPRRISQLSLPGALDEVTVDGGFAYVAAAGKGGVHIVDVRQPAAPFLVTTLAPGAEARSVHKSGSRLYAGFRTAGFQVYDVSQPASPVLLEQFDSVLNGYGLWVAGNTAVLAAGEAGLQAVDAGGPVTLSQMGASRFTGWAWDLEVIGNRAYVADSRRGLWTIQLREGVAQTLDFSPPRLASTLDSPLSLTASVASALPVNYSPVSGPASVVGNQLFVSSPGPVTVRATQAGDVQFLPVSADRTITFRDGIFFFDPVVLENGGVRFSLAGANTADLLFETTTDLAPWSPDGVSIIGPRQVQLPSGSNTRLLRALSR